MDYCLVGKVFLVVGWVRMVEHTIYSIYEINCQRTGVPFHLCMPIGWVQISLDCMIIYLPKKGMFYISIVA